MAPSVDDIVKTLRSLLISTKNGLPSKQLLREFREMENITVPFRELGFISFVQFLESTNEFLLFNGPADVTVVAKVSKESLHVAALVSTQNCAKKNKKKKPAFRPQTRNISHNFQWKNTAQPKVSPQYSVNTLAWSSLLLDNYIQRLQIMNNLIQRQLLVNHFVQQVARNVPNVNRYQPTVQPNRYSMNSNNGLVNRPNPFTPAHMNLVPAQIHHSVSVQPVPQAISLPFVPPAVQKSMATRVQQPVQVNVASLPVQRPISMTPIQKIVPNQENLPPKPLAMNSETKSRTKIVNMEQSLQKPIEPEWDSKPCQRLKQSISQPTCELKTDNNGLTSCKKSLQKQVEPDPKPIAPKQNHSIAQSTSDTKAVAQNGAAGLGKTVPKVIEPDWDPQPIVHMKNTQSTSRLEKQAEPDWDPEPIHRHKEDDQQTNVSPNLASSTCATIHNDCGRRPELPEENEDAQADDPELVLEAYCKERGFDMPFYSAKRTRFGKYVGKVFVEGVTYSTYPIEYAEKITAKAHVASIAVSNIKEFKVSNDPPDVIAQKIFDCIGDDGVTMKHMPNIFEQKYGTSLPGNWKEIIEQRPKMFVVSMTTNLSIIYRKKEAATKEKVKDGGDMTVKKLPPIQLPWHKSVWDVQVNSIVSPDEVWGCVADLESLDELNNTLELIERSLTAEMNMKPCDVTEGGIYLLALEKPTIDKNASKFVAFRVKVQKIDDCHTKAWCFYIDDGFKEWIDITGTNKSNEPRFYPLSEQLQKYPAQAINFGVFTQYDCSERAMRFSPLKTHLKVDRIYATKIMSTQSQFNHQLDDSSSSRICAAFDI